MSDHDYDGEATASITWDYGEKPTPNLPLLRKVWEWVQLEDAKGIAGDGIPNGQWRQSAWRMPMWGNSQLEMRYDVRSDRVPECGSAFCFAGYTAEMSPECEWLSDVPNHDKYLFVTVEGYEGTYPVGMAAQLVLGLDAGTAANLFSAGNSIRDIETILSEVFAAEGETL